MGWFLTASALATFLVLGCGDDEAPSADFTVEVQTARFFPSQLSVPVGSTVRWVNVNPRDSLRTVTSGTGVDDPEAGAAFDDTLSGYAQGSTEGESVIHQFDDRGTFYYFSRIPQGSDFTGRVEVQ